MDPGELHRWTCSFWFILSGVDDEKVIWLRGMVLFVRTDMDAAAGASGATAAMEDADGIGATSSRTNADISETGPVPPEGTPPSLAKGNLSRADGSSSAGMDEDVEMLERVTTDTLHGDGAPAAANGYMDVDVTPAETSFLTSPDGKEQPAGADRIGGQPTVIKVSHRTQPSMSVLKCFCKLRSANLLHAMRRIYLWESLVRWEAAAAFHGTHSSTQRTRAYLVADVTGQLRA